MGWGCNADKRDAFLHQHNSIQVTEDINPDAVVVAIDGNAAARSQAVGLRPAAHIAAHILKPVTMTTRDVLICFDNANIPEIRASEVHASRQAQSRVVGATAAEIEMFDETPVPWETMFASPQGKVVAFKAIIKALKMSIIRSPVPHCRYLITMPGKCNPEDSFFWSFPFDRPCEYGPVLKRSFYGEAEAQLAVCIKHSAANALANGVAVPKTALYTIDTDALYQMLGLFHPRLEVVLGTVWETGDGVVHRSAVAAKRASTQLRAANKKRKRGESPVSAAIVRKFKRVDVSGLASSLCGGSAMRMANAQWWQLLAGGCDYNFTGASGFGWFNQTCIKLQTNIVIDENGINLHKFARLMLTYRNKKCQERNVAKFCEMLCRTAFSWRYYQWEPPEDGQRVAHPPFSKSLFEAGGAETVTEWLSSVPVDKVVPIGRRVVELPLESGHAGDVPAAAAYCA